MLCFPAISEAQGVISLQGTYKCLSRSSIILCSNSSSRSANTGFCLLQNFVFVSIVLPDFAASHSYLSLFSTSLPYFHQLKIFLLFTIGIFFSIPYRCFFEPKIIALSFASFCHCDNTRKFQKLINFNFEHFEIKIRSF